MTTGSRRPAAIAAPSALRGTGLRAGIPEVSVDVLARSQYVFQNRPVTQSVTARLALGIYPRQALENGAPVLRDQEKGDEMQGNHWSKTVLKAVFETTYFAPPVTL